MNEWIVDCVGGEKGRVFCDGSGCINVLGPDQGSGKPGVVRGTTRQPLTVLTSRPGLV